MFSVLTARLQDTLPGALKIAPSHLFRHGSMAVLFIRYSSDHGTDFIPEVPWFNNSIFPFRLYWHGIINTGLNRFTYTK